MSVDLPAPLGPSRPVIPLPNCSDTSSKAAEELQNFVKERLATYSYPREIEFVDALPMTVTGKVIRKQLKARATVEAKQ